MTTPDTMRILINQTFEKIWEIQNIGNIPWENRKLVCIDDAVRTVSTDTDFDSPASRRYLRPRSKSIDIPRTLPGDSVKLSVGFLAPSYPGTHTSYWKITDENGEICFLKREELSCMVRILTV